ncbi:MAG: tRNA (guanine-N2)-dimethyltransferase [Epsilonproteobacteria bacterium]|nr:tRNA (guanine-N2)-dimethyltransferase [Campylobacterota bacterium]
MYLVNDKRLSKMKQVLLSRQNTLRVFLDNVYSNHNLSAIVRTCDAVNVGYLYYRHQKHQLLNNNITMGAHNWVFCEYVDDIHTLYKQHNNYQIVVTSLDEDSIDFREVDYTLPTLVVLGNEVDGVSKESLSYATHKITIPMYGMTQSLNVSVSAGIVLYEAQRQRALRNMYSRQTISDELIQQTLRKWAYDDIIQKELKRPRQKQNRDGSVEWLNKR